MLTDSKLRSQVDALWDKFWSDGLTNPLDAIDRWFTSKEVQEILSLTKALSME